LTIILTTCGHPHNQHLARPLRHAAFLDPTNPKLTSEWAYLCCEEVEEAGIYLSSWWVCD
jgi:hypothetical protein